MPANNKKKPAAAVKVDVPIVASATHKFLATIEGRSMSDRGQVVGKNGIRWSV